MEHHSLPYLNKVLPFKKEKVWALICPPLGLWGEALATNTLCNYNTSNVTTVTEVWSTSFGLVLHVQHLRVIGYNFPFHMHISCIRYCTVLANTAVLCMHVHIVCLPVHGTPGECYYSTLLCCNYFHRRVWYRVLSLCYACIWGSGIILSP